MRHVSLVLLHHNGASLATAAELADSSDQDPRNTEDRCEDSVGDLELLRRVGDIQAQAAVDDTEGDQQAADEKM